MCQAEESSHLLGGPAIPGTPKKEKDYTGNARNNNIMQWGRRVIDMIFGFGLCALIAVTMNGQSHNQTSRQPAAPSPQNQNHVYQQQEQQDDDYSAPSSSSSDVSGTRSKHHRPTSLRAHSDDDPFDKTIGPSHYQQFQAMGFQIYTGGAPALIVQETPAMVGSDTNAKKPIMIHNPECNGLNSYGHFDDYDITNNTLPESLWQCYLGHEDPYQDVQHRLEIMKDAVERAYQVASRDENILKIFIAPEFFWRGREGAYIFDGAGNSTQTKSKAKKSKSASSSSSSGKMLEDDTCTEVCQIMLGLEQLVSQKKYKDWLFLFGTVVVSEALPEDDDYDMLFYNFAPVYKGYDPDMQDHYGKRFLVPKRYVSNVDFLTPIRQYNGKVAKELVEMTEQQLELARQRQRNQEENDKDSSVRTEVTPSKNDEPIVVANPFELQRDFYDRDMWYDYKDELTNLGYTMIEYDWLILDNITFTIEVCLDHDARTALNAYLADNVLGSPTRIPKSVVHWDDVAHKYVGSVEQVKIPRHQAQLSLVSSMGMTANPQSLALCQNGTLILQDGQSDKNGSMVFKAEDDCGQKSWHFDGGTEYISRTTAITTTRIDFKYQIHVPETQVGIYDDLYNDRDDAWKKAIDGVFTTTKYEPRITMYPIRDIAKV